MKPTIILNIHGMVSRCSIASKGQLCQMQRRRVQLLWFFQFNQSPLFYTINIIFIISTNQPYIYETIECLISSCMCKYKLSCNALGGITAPKKFTYVSILKRYVRLYNFRFCWLLVWCREEKCFSYGLVTIFFLSFERQIWHLKHQIRICWLKVFGLDPFCGIITTIISHLTKNT